jgi:DNA polymerase III alpha subunit
MPDFTSTSPDAAAVIDYVQQRYGRDQVAQIITFERCRRAACCATSARVLQMPYGQVDKLTKLVPQNPAAPVTLAQARSRANRSCRRSATRTRWSRAPSTSPSASKG